MLSPPNQATLPERGSALDPSKQKTDALVAQSSEISAVRTWEEIRKGPDGYPGGVITVRRYVWKIRPARGCAYKEVTYEPGQGLGGEWRNAIGFFSIGGIAVSAVLTLIVLP